MRPQKKRPEGALKAVAFDLGDTLLEYEGIPPSWESHYPAALQHLAQYIGCPVAEQAMQDACAILKQYNTRIHPRAQEVDFSTILAELLHVFGVRYTGYTEAAATVFFSVFRQRLRCFPDAAEWLGGLLQSGVRIARS